MVEITGLYLQAGWLEGRQKEMPIETGLDMAGDAAERGREVKISTSPRVKQAPEEDVSPKRTGTRLSAITLLEPEPGPQSGGHLLSNCPVHMSHSW